MGTVDIKSISIGAHPGQIFAIYQRSSPTIIGKGYHSRFMWLSSPKIRKLGLSDVGFPLLVYHLSIKEGVLFFLGIVVPSFPSSIRFQA